MRKLTVAPRMSESDLQLVEEIVKQKFPHDFREFLKDNAGLSHYERIYLDSENTEWSVNHYCNFTELYKLTHKNTNSYKKTIVVLLPLNKKRGGSQMIAEFSMLKAR